MEQTIYDVKNLALLGALTMAAVSFWISFTAVSNLALTLGITPEWLFPVMIDGCIILALVWRFTGINVQWSQITMFAYVIISVALNFYAHNTVPAGICASLAPVTLFVSSEICSQILKVSKPVEPEVETAAPKKSTATKMRDEKGRFVKKVE
jgi:hypothetical protein